jgi:mono/diheme cytochrome c family protein
MCHGVVIARYAVEPMPRVPLLLLWMPLLAARVTTQQATDDAGMTAFVRAHCIECHGVDATKGELDLTQDAADPVARAWRWSRLRDRVLAGEMPPADAESPTPAARQAFVASVASVLRGTVPRLPPDPGRVTVRRLSRTQWEHTVRDLFGASVTTTGFPADDLGYGFDTIGDALTFSTLHLETYLAAAREVAAAVFDGEDPARPTIRRFEAELMQLVAGPGAGMTGEVANLYTRATVEQAVRLPRDGVYVLRVLAGADQAGDEPAKMVLRLDGPELTTIEVGERALRPFELRTPLPGGAHRITLAFVNDYYDPKNPDPARRDRNLRIDWLEVVGPTDTIEVPAARQWLQAPLRARGDDAARVRAVVRALLPRAYRRPATDAEIARSTQLGAAVLRGGGSLTEALRAVLQASLTSPHFLFRLETGAVAGAAGSVVALGGNALASRLSYFLWGSAPDETLSDRARQGTLSETAGLTAEVDRMLADARAESLATDFASQWLELRNLADRTPDPARFPDFDDELRASLRRETELLFLTVLREGRDVRDLLDCDFTHVDARLAAFYGLEVPEGAQGFVRVMLPPALRERGGVLGHASVLAITSNPTRTSPVKRGKWVLENLLGQPPPPPPPGNDTLANEAAIDSSRSFRDQLAQHRERRACAVCHVRMDALGFALERYDAIGRYREQDAGGVIDCSGELPDGRVLAGLADLKAALRQDPAFVRTLARKLFVYAVGRDARPHDRLRLDLGVDELLLLGKVTLRDLVLLVVQDDAFQRRVVEAPR